MLAAAGAFLTTERGGWVLIAVTVVCCSLWPAWSFDAATFALSVLAILVGVAILSYQGSRERRDDARDRAMHVKLDAIVIGEPTVDSSVAGLERRSSP